MPLTELTDHHAIGAALAAAVERDPVRCTMFGTLGTQLEDTAWAVVDAERLAVRTSARRPVVLGAGWLDALDELAHLLGRLPDLAGVNGPEAVVAPLVAQLRGDRSTARMAQRLFRLDELIPPAGVSGGARVAGSHDRAVVAAFTTAFDAEEGWLGRDVDAFTDTVIESGGGWLWVDTDGTPVSLACRHRAAAGSARVGPVYTPPEHRGRGYGSAATAAASRSILDEGAIPVLFTDLANPTSNKIYRLLGYHPVEDRVIVTFTG